MNVQIGSLVLFAVACAGNAGLAAAQDHAQQQATAPAGHDQNTSGHEMHEPTPQPAETQEPAMEHAAMGHAMPPQVPTAPHDLIPVLTDADRAAAFPAVSGHAAHDSRVFGFAQLARFEAWDADEGTGLLWDGLGWVGGDIQKRSAALIRSGGTLVTVVGPTDVRPADGLAVDFVVEADRAQLSEIVQRVRDGRLRPNVGKVASLDDAVAAFNATERRAGKTIVRVRP